MSPKGLKQIFNAIGRKIFNKSDKTEVEYGQTLSKKRRRNCILKSVSSLSGSNDENGRLVHPTYRIEFEFSKDDSQFRGSVMNFQKIDPADVCCLRKCCEKCFCSSGDADADSASGSSSVSSDSACDLTSSSSCDDLDCEYREIRPRKKRTKKKKKPRPAEEPDPDSVGTVQNFIRIHSEHFKNGITNEACDLGTVDRTFGRSLADKKDEPEYETLGPKFPEPNYDILTTRPDYNVLEPRYENLKLVENFYEQPRERDPTFGGCSENCPFKKIKDLVHSNKTYDEVIESLKLLHSSNCSGKTPGSAESCCGTERADNEINYYFENYANLQNRFNNDVERDLLSY